MGCGGSRMIVVEPDIKKSETINSDKITNLPNVKENSSGLISPKTLDVSQTGKIKNETENVPHSSTSSNKKTLDQKQPRSGIEQVIPSEINTVKENKPLEVKSKIPVFQTKQESCLQSEKESVELRSKEERVFQEILNKLGSILNENEISVDDVNIRFSRSLDIIKDAYSKPFTIHKDKFCLLKKNPNINWQKKPYSKVVEDVEDYFRENNLTKYFSFEWTSNLLEFEKFNLDLVLKKSKSDGGFEDFKFSEHKSDKNKLIYFINPNDIQCLEVLKLLDEDIEVFPIHCERAGGKGEALSRKQQIEILGYKNDLYLMPKSKNGENSIPYEKYINFSTNDNYNQSLSVCLLIDNSGFIRFIGHPKKLAIKKYDVNYNNQDIESMQEIFNKLPDTISSQEPFSFSLEFKIVNIFNKNLEKETFTILNPLKFETNLNEDFSTKIEKDKFFHKFFDIMVIKKFLVNLPKIKLTSDTSNRILSKFIKKIKEEIEDENMANYNYNLRTSIVKTFNCISNKEEIQTITKKYSNDLIINIHKAYSSIPDLIEINKQIISNPYFKNLKSIMTMPQINESLEGFRLVDDKDENISIDSNGNPRLLLFYNTCSNSQEIKILEKKIKRILEPLEDCEVYNIFLGQSLKDSLVNPESFYNRPIYLLPKDETFFGFQNLDNDSCFLCLILLNKENKIISFSNGDEVDILQTLNRLSEDEEEIEYHNCFPINKNFWDENIKIEFEKFINIIQNLLLEDSKNYIPIIELSYEKEFSFDNEEEIDRKYQNLFLKIICKSDTQFIENTKIQKYFTKFEKKYNGLVEVVKLPTCSLNINYTNCDICNKSISGEPIIDFYLDEENKKIMCFSCNFNEEKPADSTIISQLWVRFEKDNSNILNEILEPMLNYNQSNNNLVAQDNFKCSICGDPLENENIYWQSLIHLNPESKDYLPLIICNSKCVNLLTKNEINEYHSERNKLRELGIDRNNLLLRKIIVSTTAEDNFQF